MAKSYRQSSKFQKQLQKIIKNKQKSIKVLEQISDDPKLSKEFNKILATKNVNKLKPFLNKFGLKLCGYSTKGLGLTCHNVCICTPEGDECWWVCI